MKTLKDTTSLREKSDINFKLQFLKLFRSDCLSQQQMTSCYDGNVLDTQFNCLNLETAEPYSSKIRENSGFFARFRNDFAALSRSRSLIGRKAEVLYASFLMLRVSLCVCTRSASFTHSLNVVPAHPITVKQSPSGKNVGLQQVL